MIFSRRALALASAAGLAALAVSGCGTTSSSSSSSGNTPAATVPGHRLAIVLSAPHGYQSNPVLSDTVDAEKLAFDSHHNEVTKYKLVLATSTLGNSPVSDNARTTILASDPIAYIGELQPGVSEQTVGITNALGILQVSPTDTALELGQSTPAVSGAPKSFFQQWSTYGRTFARVVPSSQQEADAQATEMKALNVSSLYVDADSSDYGRALADAVRVAARGTGITLTHDPSSAGAIFYGASDPARAASFFNRIANKNPSAKLFGTSALDSPAFLSAVSSTAAHNLHVTTPGFMPSALPSEGKAFVSAFKKAYRHSPNGQAIFGFEAVTAVINDLAKQGANANNRADVVKGFLGHSVGSSVLGGYKINADGNTSLDAFVWNKVSAGALVPIKAAASTS